jgi:hypothetical protein
LRSNVSLFFVIFLTTVILAVMLPVNQSETIQDSTSQSVAPSAAYVPPAVEFNQTYRNGTGNAMVKTSDGGYVIAGTINDTLSGVSGLFGKMCLIRTDSSGNILWNKTYTRIGYADFAYSVIQTSDGGYAVVGLSCLGVFYTYPGPVAHPNQQSAALIKVDSSGNKQWGFGYYFNPVVKLINGVNVTVISATFGYSVVQTDDGGYAVGGCTNYFSSDSTEDIFLIKTTQNGTVQFNQNYPAEISTVTGHSIIRTSDGNYALAGETNTSATNNLDVYLIKADINGNMIWNKTYGGTGVDTSSSLIQTSDGGYAVAGSTTSFGDGTIDFWLTKLDANGNMQWNKTYGGAGSDSASSLVQASDGGYVIAGTTNSSGAGNTDAWIVKTDTNGNAQWNETLGGPFNDAANAVVQTSDSGFVYAGYFSNSSTNYFSLVKLAAVNCALSVSSAHGNPVPTSGSFNYTFGAQVSCSVVSPVTEGNMIWTCTGWSGTGSVSSGTGTSTTFTITQDSSIIWNWQGTPVKRSLNVVSAHGTSNPTVGTHNYEHGLSVTVSVPSPVNEGNTVWTCTGWTGTGSVTSGSDTSATFTITQDSSITWNWQGAPVQRSLTVVSDHGTCSPSVGIHVYDHGSSVTYSVVSPVTEGNLVWTCTGWTGMGSVSSGSGTSVTFAVTQDSTLTWNWQSSPVATNSPTASPTPTQAQTSTTAPAASPAAQTDPTVSSTPSIPEFPTGIALVSFMSVVLAAALIVRKKTVRKPKGT